MTFVELSLRTTDLAPEETGATRSNTPVVSLAEKLGSQPEKSRQMWNDEGCRKYTLIS